MSDPATSPNEIKPGKLGLSLAGGGFRASLFHLGVLRRLAELDLLRRVEFISTVSGGTLIGVPYVLLLKKYLERSPEGRLSRDEYIALIDELDGVMTRGIQRNLRTRLLLNPFGVFLALVTGDTLSRRMGRLYERYLLEPIVRDMRPDRTWWERLFKPGRFPLRDLAITPGGKRVTGGLDAYNARKRDEKGSAVTAIIVNATTLNSGGRFFFTAVEVGDWYLGSFRADELSTLLERKKLLQKLTDEELDQVETQRANDTGSDREKRVASLARWWRRRRRGEKAEPADGWGGLMEVHGFPGELERAATGLMHAMKVAAWYLVDGPDRKVSGGRTPEEHWAFIREQMREIDPDLLEAIEKNYLDKGGAREIVAEFVLEFYYLRTAEAMSVNFDRDWKRLRIGHTMGASACFPPAFPPYLVYGLYDDLYVSRVGLTDGGVYDNAGVIALVDEGCTGIIASDTGGTFDTQQRSATGRLGLALRVPSVLMRALGGTQRLQLRERKRVTQAIEAMLPPPAAAWTPAQQALNSFSEARRLDGLAYFHIASPRVDPPDGSPNPIPSELDPTAVANLRTDLDGFGDAEIAALVNHGYDMADRYVRRYMTALCDATGCAKVPPKAPKQLFEPTEQWNNILLVGRARFFRSLMLRSPISLLFSLATVLAAGWLVYRAGISVAIALRSVVAALGKVTNLVDDIVGLPLRLLRWIRPSTPEQWAASPSEVPILFAALIVLAGVPFILLKMRRPRKKLRTGKTASVVRIVLTGRKWLRAMSGSFLMVLWGLPAIMAAAASMLAAVSFVFYHLPFMRATRVKPEQRL